jgi:hypothetical protein
MSGNQDIPWYRQFWPWFLMVPPASAVVGGFITAFLAGGPPAMVIDDFGELAMATERHPERDNQALQLGLSAELELTPLSNDRGSEIELRLHGKAAEQGAWPRILSLQLIHSTRAELDERVTLQLQDDTYRALARHPSGRIYLTVQPTDGSWRLKGVIADGERRVRLGPSVPPVGNRSP